MSEIMEAIMAGGASDDGASNPLKEFFNPSFRQLKQWTEVSPDMTGKFATEGLIQRRFHSKVLKIHQEEVLTFLRSKDRKGILEFVEMVLSQRHSAEEEGV